VKYYRKKVFTQGGMGKPEKFSQDEWDQQVQQTVEYCGRQHYATAAQESKEAFDSPAIDFYAKLRRDRPDLKKPIVVITAGKGHSAQYQEEWMKLQNDLANLSSQSKHIIATKSMHGIQVFEPELIVAEIKNLVTTP
jgi:hypothetical protein